MKVKEMAGLFFNVDYLPNRLAYVVGSEKGRINILYFCKEKGSEFKAIKTSIPVFKKGDLKPIKSFFEPTERTMNLISECLNN